MKKILLAFSIMLPCALFAQEGKITVVQDSSIDKVLHLYQTFATEKRAVSGFRIQLGSNSNRQLLLEMKARFQQNYPDMTAYIIYQQPQFKLRIGDFRNRTDANVFMSELKGSYSTLFIVPDKVYVEGVEW